MNLSFRLVIFEGTIEIDRVPIYECEESCYHEVLPEIKEHLKQLLATLKAQDAMGRMNYTQFNELAHIIFDVYQNWDEENTDSFESVLEQTCREHINFLLDLYSCAKDTGDSVWMKEITDRLSQMSNNVKDHQFTEVNQRFPY